MTDNGETLREELYAVAAEQRQKAGGVPALIAHTARELDEMELPELVWVINGIAPVGGMLLLGKPKAGKTTLVCQFGYAIATGKKVLGEVSVQKGAVLLLLYEDTKRRFKTRMRKIAGDVQSMPDNLTVAFREKNSLRLDNGLLDQIRAWHAKALAAGQTPMLCAIDTLAAVRPVIRGNDKRSVYQAEYDTVIAVNDLANELGIFIAILHHTRKLQTDDFIDDASGTAGLTGAADTVSLLRRLATGGFEFVGRGRDVEEFEIGLMRNSDGFRKVGTATELRLTNDRRKILDALRAGAGPMTPAKVKKAGGFASVDSVQRLLTEMANAQEGVIRVKHGVYQAVPEEPPPF